MYMYRGAALLLEDAYTVSGLCVCVRAYVCGVRMFKGRCKLKSQPASFALCNLTHTHARAHARARVQGFESGVVQPGFSRVASWSQPGHQ